MGKKNNSGRGQPKRKEMFNELQTLEEEKLIKIENLPNRSLRNECVEMIPEEDDEAQNGRDLAEDMSEKISKLFAKNVLAF